MNKLFVFGCSFTKGDGCLEGEPYTLKYKKSDKDLIWPEILAEELNLNITFPLFLFNIMCFSTYIHI